MLCHRSRFGWTSPRLHPRRDALRRDGRMDALRPTPRGNAEGHKVMPVVHRHEKRVAGHPDAARRKGFRAPKRSKQSGMT